MTLVLALVAAGGLSLAMAPAASAAVKPPGPRVALPGSVSFSTVPGQEQGGAGTPALNAAVATACRSGQPIAAQEWFTLPPDPGRIRARSASSGDLIGHGSGDYLPSDTVALVDYATARVLSCGNTPVTTSSATVAVVHYFDPAVLDGCYARRLCGSSFTQLDVGPAPVHPTNDLRSAAHVIGALPFSESTDTEYATASAASDPDWNGDCEGIYAPTKYNTVWWRYTATASGALPIAAGTNDDRDSAPRLDVYDATNGQLVLATAPSADGCGNELAPVRPVTVVAGHTYLIQAFTLFDYYSSGAPVRGGPVTLNVGALGTPGQVPAYYTESTSTSATLYLPAPGTNPATPATTSIQIAVQGGPTRSVSPSSSPITVSGLAPGAASTVTVRAVNSRGAGVPQTVTITTPDPALPDYPHNVSASASAAAATATVSWQPPTSGPAPTGYVVTRSGRDTGGNGAWTSAVLPAAARSFTFHYLVPGSSYSLTVRAVNAAGSGPELSDGAVLPGPPTRPARVDASFDAATHSATISWDPPVYATAPVTGYRVTRSGTDSGGNGAWTTTVGPDASTFVFRYLNAYEPYTFSVQALSALGDSPVTTFTGSFTAPTAAKPNTVTATRGSASALVTWIPPTTTGGSAVTGYRIRRFAAGTSTILSTSTVPATARSFNAVGLTSGTAYSFDVTARNSSGLGSPSARTAVVTPGP